MSDNRGWIKLHRSIISDPLFNAGKYSKGQAWVFLNLAACYEDKPFPTDRGTVHLKRGELAYSLRSLARIWGWSVNGVKSYLATLKTLGRIDTRNAHVTTVITMLYYNEEQKRDTRDDTRRDTRDDYIQEDKEEKEVRTHGEESLNDLRFGGEPDTDNSERYSSGNQWSPVVTTGTDRDRDREKDIESRGPLCDQGYDDPPF